MKKLEIKTGDRYGKLTILKEIERKINKRNFLCECDCGKIKTFFLSNITTGKTKSCGCDIATKITIRNLKHGHNFRKKTSSEYTSWSAMKHRCLNETAKGYRNYGGRGIKVCDRWLNSFENFFYDMGAKPNKNYSLDRIDVNGNYEPNNCRWATMIEQQNNRRNNKKR